MNEGLDLRTIQQSADECGVSDNSVRGLYADVTRGEKHFWKKRGVSMKKLNKQDGMRARITRETRAAIAEREIDDGLRP